HQSGEKQRQIELALEQARYEATRARRQYDTVDPDNRLVASELERRWNTALMAVRALEEELEALLRRRPAAMSAEERQSALFIFSTHSHAREGQAFGGGNNFF